MIISKLFSNKWRREIANAAKFLSRGIILLIRLPRMWSQTGPANCPAPIPWWLHSSVGRALHRPASRRPWVLIPLKQPEIFRRLLKRQLRKIVQRSVRIIRFSQTLSHWLKGDFTMTAKFSRAHWLIFIVNKRTDFGQTHKFIIYARMT